MSDSLPHAFDDYSDDDRLTPLSSNADSSDDEAPVPQTEAEKTREQELLQDSMAIVLSPYLVKCRTCGSNIKLSMKSLFDGYHWRTHRIRCLKKHNPTSESLTPNKPNKRIPKFSKAKAKERANFDIFCLHLDFQTAATESSGL
ncbi:hypothetical protein C0993_011314 [Termitomyces sp. T159_Od127]|nr:hypothetical protein C0993_011314 [Termitomyces sp. T159_Od127]